MVPATNMKFVPESQEDSNDSPIADLQSGMRKILRELIAKQAKKETSKKIKILKPIEED